MRRFLFIAALCLAPLAFANDGSLGLTTSTRELARYPMQYSGAVDWCSIGQCPTLLFDGSAASSGATIVLPTGQTMTKVSTPTRVDAPIYPSGILGTIGKGHRFDGSDDAWTCADATCTGLDPAGDFTVVCAWRTETVSGEHAAIGKWLTTGNQRGWMLEVSGTGCALYWSKDGAASNSITASGTLTTNKINFCAMSYDYVADGTSTAIKHLDGVTTTQASLAGPVFNSSSDIGIGLTGARAFDGDIYQCAFWDGKAATQAALEQLHLQWKGRLSTSGVAISTAITTPPAFPAAYPGSGVEPFMFTLGAVSAMPGKISATRGGLPSSEALTNQIFRGSFETCTQSTNTEPDSWTVAETDGAGDGNVLCSTASMAHGLKSLELKATAADSVASVASACITAGIGYDLAVDYMRKVVSTTDGHLLVKINEYDGSDCTTAIESDTVIDETLAAGDWGIKHGSRVLAQWHANTSSYTVSWVTSGIADVLIDATQLRHTSLQPSDVFCLNDAASAPACSAVAYTTPNPLPANAGRSVKVTVSGPRAASGIAASNVWSTTGGAANEDNLFVNTGSVFCRNSDASNTSRYYRGATALSADTELTYLWGWGSDGAGGCLVSDGSSDYTVEGAGNGLHTAAGSTLTIGGVAFWVRDLVVYREFLRSMP